MKSGIYVNLREVRDANYDLPYVEAGADYVKMQALRMKRNIPDCISNKYQIRQRMDMVCREIGKLEMRIGRLYEATNSCMEQYADTEHENNKNAQAFY